MEVRGRGQPAEAEVLSEETPGHGCQFLDGEEAEEPAASGLPPGRRLPSAATVGPRSRCSTEGQQGRNGNARSGEKTHEIQGGRWEERPGSWRHIIIFQDSKIKSIFLLFFSVRRPIRAAQEALSGGRDDSQQRRCHAARSAGFLERKGGKKKQNLNTLQTQRGFVALRGIL